jgi:hypothetical protein
MSAHGRPETRMMTILFLIGMELAVWPVWSD